MIAFLFASSCSQSFFSRMVHNNQLLQCLYHNAQEAMKKNAIELQFYAQNSGEGQGDALL